MIKINADNVQQVSSRDAIATAMAEQRRQRREVMALQVMCALLACPTTSRTTPEGKPAELARISVEYVDALTDYLDSDQPVAMIKEGVTPKKATRSRKLSIP